MRDRRTGMAFAAMALAAAGALSCAAPPKAAPPIAVAKVGDVSDDLVSRVRTWAEYCTAFTLRTLDPVKLQDKSLDEIGRRASALAGPDGSGVIALAFPDESVKAHGVFLAEQRAVVINVRALRDGADDEAWARRVERQVVRGIGMLLGLEPCPNPTCTLYAYQNNEELDHIGRGFCPPCLKKAQQEALQRGLPVDKEAPFFMLR
jgi:hypothetical protein